MFKAGKKYKTTYNKFICIAVDGNVGWLKFEYGHITARYSPEYEEYEETPVAYVGLYERSDGFQFWGIASVNKENLTKLYNPLDIKLIQTIKLGE